MSEENERNNIQPEEGIKEAAEMVGTAEAVETAEAVKPAVSVETAEEVKPSATVDTAEAVKPAAPVETISRPEEPKKEGRGRCFFKSHKMAIGITVLVILLVANVAVLGANIHMSKMFRGYGGQMMERGMMYGPGIERGDRNDGYNYGYQDPRIEKAPGNYNAPYTQKAPNNVIPGNGKGNSSNGSGNSGSGSGSGGNGSGNSGSGSGSGGGSGSGSGGGSGSGNSGTVSSADGTNA